MATPDSSAALRVWVDTAVGPTYDRAFRLADALTAMPTSREPGNGSGESLRWRRALRLELRRLGITPDDAGSWSP